MICLNIKKLSCAALVIILASCASLTERTKDADTIAASAGMRKQEIIFSLLQAESEKNGQIYGEGVLQLTHFSIQLEAMSREVFAK